MYRHATMENTLADYHQMKESSENKMGKMDKNGTQGAQGNQEIPENNSSPSRPSSSRSLSSLWNQMSSIFTRRNDNKRRDRFSIYVAGKWADKDEIGTKIRALEAKGFEVTHDWTKVEVPDITIRLHTMRNDDDDEEDNHPIFPIEYMEECSSNDVRGVADADVLVVSMEHTNYAYRGAWTEIGVALGLNKPVIIFSPNSNGNKNALNVFFWHKYVRHVTDWDSVEEQLNLMRAHL